MPKGGISKKIRVGILNLDFVNNVSENTIRAIKKCKGSLSSLGISASVVSLMHAKSAYASYYTVACAEASSNLARFDSVRYGYRSSNYTDANSLYTNSRTEGFGGEVKRRILFGTLALSAEYSDDFYNKACSARSLISSELERIFEEFDIVIMPTAPSEAYKKGEASRLGFEASTDDIFCTIAALAGLPALSIPVKIGNSMPVGIQLVGKHCSEPLIYSLAHILETNFKEDEK